MLRKLYALMLDLSSLVESWIIIIIIVSISLSVAESDFSLVWKILRLSQTAVDVPFITNDSRILLHYVSPAIAKFVQNREKNVTEHNGTSRPAIPPV